MATQLFNVPSPTRFSARALGEAFIDFYYNILQLYPDRIKKFYTEASRLSRADGDVEIHQEVFVLEYGKFKVEKITSLDCEELLPGSWLVMVKGSVFTKMKSRLFVQSFVLAQKEGGYFVLNDIFRYLNEDKSPILSQPSVTVHESPQQLQGHFSTKGGFFVTSKQEEREEPKTSMIEVEDEELFVSSEVLSQPSETREQEDREKLQHAELTVPEKQEGDFNKTELTPASFASILLKGNAAGPSVPFTTSATEIPGSQVVKQRSSSSWCVYIRNLPLSISVSQLKEQVRKFGSIRAGGVDIKKQGNYAFVEFKAKDSAEAAIRASPISIDGRVVYVDRKKYGSTSW